MTGMLLNAHNLQVSIHRCRLNDLNNSMFVWLVLRWAMSMRRLLRLSLSHSRTGFPPSCWFPQKLQYSDQDLTWANIATEINWPVCLRLNSCSCLRGSGWIWYSPVRPCQQFLHVHNQDQPSHVNGFISHSEQMGWQLHQDFSCRWNDIACRVTAGPRSNLKGTPNPTALWVHCGGIMDML